MRAQAAGAARNQNPIKALGHILRTEGVGGLYRGMNSTLFTLFAANFIYFYAFHILRCPTPSTLNPQLPTLNPQPSTLNPQPSTLNPQPSTLNPQPSTLNPQYLTLNRQLPIPNNLHMPMRMQKLNPGSLSKGWPLPAARRAERLGNAWGSRELSSTCA